MTETGSGRTIQGISLDVVPSYTVMLRGSCGNETLLCARVPVLVCHPNISGDIPRGRSSSACRFKVKSPGNMAAARPVSGVIHEHQSVTSDLQANSDLITISALNSSCTVRIKALK